MLRFDRFIKARVAGISLSETPAGETTAEADTSETVDSTAEVVETIPIIGSSDIGSRQQKPVDIMSSDTAEPFSMSVVFRGYCLFRYIVDGSLREENATTIKGKPPG